MKKLLFLLIMSSCFLTTVCQEKKEEPESRERKITLSAGLGPSLFTMYSSSGSVTNMILIEDDLIDFIVLTADYSFSRRFSTGVLFENAGMLTTPDFKIITPYNDISLYNAGIIIKYKLFHLEKNNVSINFIPLYSRVQFRDKSGNTNYSFENNGFGFQAGIGWEHYFGKHIGLFLSSRYTYSKYRSDVYYTSQNQTTVGVAENKYSGLGAIIGPVFRF